MKEVAAALAAGDYEVRDDGSVFAAGEVLAPNEVVRTETVTVEGWGVAQDGNLSVAVDLDLDDDLIMEGRVYDLVRALNEQRKQEGLDLTDRISLRLPSEHADLVEHHGEWIASEVLATSIEVDEAISAPVIERV